ncbi:DUF4279 domain-containing protein [Faecalibacter rhinopitheci]|uniref:DUF4279 domain-containing protein n=1 Tax=Faecalibacter rhinopitheci TaxID=2779678 RepID=A0A8J7FRU8_9FLAO|nr:DUF4279 domain-containing protein [Faecalibacter rhinopitheci]MBF0598449.1 DUF4279 domain-containing protein [Faecalibacter rhinopitheci]
MTHAQIIEVIQNELENKEFGVTEQILEIHNPLYVNGIIQINNIQKKNDEIIVFIPIEDEKFYLAIYIDEKDNLITGISTEPYISVYFRATSDELSDKELKKMTTLNISKSWNKGDKRKSGNGFYSFSNITIEPNQKAGDFESKISELLLELNKDKEGVKKLIENADGYIQVAMEFHNGNGMIGGPNLTNQIIKSLSNLNLSIDFDLYVSGNEYKP